MTTASASNEVILQLRAKTGAGFMDIKRALGEAGGDFDKALEILRKKGLADVSKRTARAVKEGLIHCAGAASAGGLVELNCETDFVARTPDFQALAKTLADKVAQGKVQRVEDAQSDLSPVAAKLGENIVFRRFERFVLPDGKPGLVKGYVHGGRKGALIELGGVSGGPDSKLAWLATELLLQTVAMSPKWLKSQDVPPATLEKEREIYAEQAKAEGKPLEAHPKIVEGRLRKFFQEYCLLDQLHIRDNKTPISQILAQVGSELKAEIEVRRFVLFQLGVE